MLDMGECCFPVPVSGLASDGPTLTLRSSRSRARGDAQGVRGRVLLLAEAWSRAAVPKLLDMRDWLHGRQFFHEKRAGREWGNGWW